MIKFAVDDVRESVKDTLLPHLQAWDAETFTDIDECFHVPNPFANLQVNICNQNIIGSTLTLWYACMRNCLLYLCFMHIEYVFQEPETIELGVELTSTGSRHQKRDTFQCIPLIRYNSYINYVELFPHSCW